MSEVDRGTDRAGRRGKRFLSPSQKYEIWLQLIRGEVTIAEAAAAQHVDRSTIMRIRTVAKEGALAALAASKPGVGARERDYEPGRRQSRVYGVSARVTRRRCGKGTRTQHRSMIMAVPTPAGSLERLLCPLVHPRRSLPPWTTSTDPPMTWMRTRSACWTR